MRVRFVLSVALLLATGCGRRELDVLTLSDGPDPCAGVTSQAACDEQASRGCSWQPNEVGCPSTDSTCAPGACLGGDPFVRAVGGQLLLHGVPFRTVGVGSWGMLLLPGCDAVEIDQRERWIQDSFDGLLPSRSSVVRLFAFQSGAGASGRDFTGLDLAVDAARRAGVRLLVILEHGAGDCSDGTPRDAEWYRSGYLTPAPGYALSYRDYARAVAERYRGEPTVLGYGVMQSLGSDDSEALRDFVVDIGQLIHGVAPSQLVSLDLDRFASGSDLSGGAASAFVSLQSLPYVDFVDVDDYVGPEPEPLDDALLSALVTIGKPAIVGEGAFPLTGDPPDLDERARRAEQRLRDWHDADFDGALLWNYLPGWETISEEFDTRADDPVLQPGGVLANAPW